MSEITLDFPKWAIFIIDATSFCIYLRTLTHSLSLCLSADQHTRPFLSVPYKYDDCVYFRILMFWQWASAD